MENKKCHNCKLNHKDNKLCPLCEGIHYCSVKCQSDDWKSHKVNCTKSFGNAIAKIKAFKSIISSIVKKTPEFFFKITDKFECTSITFIINDPDSKKDVTYESARMALSPTIRDSCRLKHVPIYVSCEHTRRDGKKYMVSHCLDLYRQ